METERVTNPNRDNADNLAVQMFCMIVQSNSGLVTKAHDLIVKKMHSENTTEASRAIGVSKENNDYFISYKNILQFVVNFFINVNTHNSF